MDEVTASGSAEFLDDGSLQVVFEYHTARSRTSGENLFVVLLVIAPSSQELGPPAIPGRFIAAHLLRQLKREGVERVVFYIGHLGDQIRDFVGTGEAFGLAVEYSFDGAELLGTGGALRAALPKLGDAFFVLNGDSYLDIRYVVVEAAFRATGPPALMTVLRNENRWDSSNVKFTDGRILRYSKRDRDLSMLHIDYGLGVVKAGIVADHPQHRFDLASVYEDLARQGRLAAFEATFRFYEIGSHGGLRETADHLRAGT